MQRLSRRRPMIDQRQSEENDPCLLRDYVWHHERAITQETVKKDHQIHATFLVTRPYFCSACDPSLWVSQLLIKDSSTVEKPPVFTSRPRLAPWRSSYSKTVKKIRQSTQRFWSLHSTLLLKCVWFKFLNFPWQANSTGKRSAPAICWSWATTDRDAFRTVYTCCTIESSWPARLMTDSETGVPGSPAPMLFSPQPNRLKAMCIRSVRCGAVRLVRPNSLTLANKQRPLSQRESKSHCVRRFKRTTVDGDAVAGGRRHRSPYTAILVVQYQTSIYRSPAWPVATSNRQEWDGGSGTRKDSNGIQIHGTTRPPFYSWIYISVHMLLYISARPRWYETCARGRSGGGGGGGSCLQKQFMPGSVAAAAAPVAEAPVGRDLSSWTLLGSSIFTRHCSYRL